MDNKDTDPKAAQTKSPALASPATTGATAGAGGAAKPSEKLVKVAPSVAIQSPKNGGTAVGPFRGECVARGVNAVKVMIVRDSVSKQATLTGGVWVTEFGVTDIGPNPTGQQDTIFALGSGPGGSASDSVKVLIQ